MCMCMRNYVYYIRIYFKYFLDPDFFFVRGDGGEEARRGGGKAACADASQKDKKK